MVMFEPEDSTRLPCFQPHFVDLEMTADAISLLSSVLCDTFDGLFANRCLNEAFGFWMAFTADNLIQIRVPPAATGFLVAPVLGLALGGSSVVLSTPFAVAVEAFPTAGMVFALAILPVLGCVGKGDFVTTCDSVIWFLVPFVVFDVSFVSIAAPSFTTEASETVSVKYSPFRSGDGSRFSGASGGGHCFLLFTVIPIVVSSFPGSAIFSVLDRVSVECSAFASADGSSFGDAGGGGGGQCRLLFTAVSTTFVSTTFVSSFAGCEIGSILIGSSSFDGAGGGGGGGHPLLLFTVV